MNVAYNMDCLEAMKEMPDNAYDLACVDPPYGAGLTENGGCKGWFSKYHQTEENRSQTVNVERERETVRLRCHGGDRWDRYSAESLQKLLPDGDSDGRHMGDEVCKKIIAWDVAPEREYFEQLFRVSRNQIIWGGNYFELPPTRCFLVWRKLTISESFSMAMCEYAWTSFNENAKIFECAPQGKKNDPRFHPTAKPIELYEWIFKHYAKQGDKILDTHLGSGSSRIAAHKMGLDFCGYEIDPTYFQLQEERFERHTAQLSLFTGG